jgi:hypothetical protein
MGLQKTFVMEAEEKRAEALRIAIRAKVLGCCERHDVHYGTWEEVANAYKLGNYLLSKKELNNQYESSRELTDLIKDVVENACDKCYACAEDFDKG